MSFGICCTKEDFRLRVFVIFTDMDLHPPASEVLHHQWCHPLIVFTRGENESRVICILRVRECKFFSTCCMPTASEFEILPVLEGAEVAGGEDRHVFMTAAMKKVNNSGPRRSPCFTPIMESITCSTPSTSNFT